MGWGTSLVKYTGVFFVLNRVYKQHNWVQGSWICIPAVHNISTVFFTCRRVLGGVSQCQHWRRQRGVTGSLGWLFPQPPPTELHPPPFSNWDCEFKAEAELDGISLLMKLDQALAPSTAVVPVQYFRLDQFTFGVLKMKSKIDDLIISLVLIQILFID